MNKYYAKAFRRNDECSKTQAAYRLELEALKQQWRIISYWEEAVNLRLADGAFYKPDFLVQELDGTLSVVEVKGGKWLLDSEKTVLLKAKMVAEKYPFRVRIVWPRAKKDGGGWAYRHFDGSDQEDTFVIISKEAK